MHKLILQICSFKLQQVFRRSVLILIGTLLPLQAYSANNNGVFGSRSLEEDMAPQYGKLLREIQINVVRNLPPSSGAAQEAARALCPDVRTRMAQFKVQKLMTLDQRLCERTQGSGCQNARMWRARTYLRQQLVSTCGVQE